jgi:cation diffusion facilitator CzcD-associated flavoprotein CzcO
MTVNQHALDTTAEPTVDVDAVIIGAGFSGLYMLHRLRNTTGLTARVFEAGGGVGGTWYWNRYPGARSDSDIYVYGFTSDEDLWREWEWSERYPEQHEIRAYLELVAQRFDLYRDITFDTRITGASFDEARNTWAVTTDAGETVSARYLVTAVGALSASNTPPFKNIDSFQGETYHTGLWPHEEVDFIGKRVGVIGTGASAVQAIPLIAKEASDHTLFQRTANYVIPANNGPVSEDVNRARLGDYAGIREPIQRSYFGFELNLLEKGAFESTDEEIHQELMPRWEEGGFGIWLGSYVDMSFFNDEANANAMTGPMNKIAIRGRGRQLLREKWDEGPRTYLGLTSAGFPNLFTITGPQSPSVRSNMPVSIEQHVDLVVKIIGEVRERGAETVEATREAEDAWVVHNAELVKPTLFETADTRYMGANIPGKPRVFMPNLSFVGPYRAKCDEVVANDYECFTFGTSKQEAAA